MIAFKVIDEGFADNVAFMDFEEIDGGELFHHTTEGTGSEQEAVARPDLDVVAVAFQVMDVGELNTSVLTIDFDEEVVLVLY